jgi:hypothetical protein
LSDAPWGNRDRTPSSPSDGGEWEGLEEKSPFSQIVADNNWDEDVRQNTKGNQAFQGDSITDAFKRPKSLLRTESIDKEDSIKRRPSYEAKEINVIVEDGEQIKVLMLGAGEFNDSVTKDVHPGIYRMCSL